MICFFWACCGSVAILHCALTMTQLSSASLAPTVLDDSSPAATILDLSSDEESDEVRVLCFKLPAILANFPECVAPYLQWPNMAVRIQQCLEYSRDCHRIEYQLAPPGQDTHFWIADVLKHGLEIVCGADICFKIGISYWPANRFHYCDYRRLPLMVLALVSEQCDFIAREEIAAITQYRKYDISGNVVNWQGDHRCMNRASGGESAYHGYSPHFLYCVFGCRKEFVSGSGASRC